MGKTATSRLIVPGTHYGAWCQAARGEVWHLTNGDHGYPMPSWHEFLGSTCTPTIRGRCHQLCVEIGNPGKRSHDNATHGSMHAWLNAWLRWGHRLPAMLLYRRSRLLAVLISLQTMPASSRWSPSISVSRSITRTFRACAPNWWNRKTQTS